MIGLYSLIYIVIKFVNSAQKNNITNRNFKYKTHQSRLSAEISKELTEITNDNDKDEEKHNTDKKA